MAGWLERIYQRAPDSIQNAMVVGFGWIWHRRRYGPTFHRALPGVLEREWWSARQFAEYQAQRLVELVRWAEAEVPYYQETFAAAGIQACEIRGLEDLPRLPFLDRETIRSRGEHLLAPSIPRRALNYYNTSGSTNSPLRIAYGPGVHAEWMAYFEARCRKWAGVNRRHSRSSVGGRLVVPKHRTEPPFWKYNPVERQVYFSTFHISPQNIKAYASAFLHYQPDYHAGYAAATYFIANLLEEMKCEVPPLKAVLTSSEPLLETMRATISRVFRTRVFDLYSAVENCCLANECEQGRMHVSPEVGIIEILDGDGKEVPAGKTGEIVATGLMNFAQPLLRYRTGDLAAWSDQECPCGRKMPVLCRLEGRIEDTIISPDGSRMVRFHGVFYNCPHVREAQVIQEELDQFVVRVVASPGFGDVERQQIVDSVIARVGSVRVKVETVEALERTARGKLRAVVSRI